MEINEHLDENLRQLKFFIDSALDEDIDDNDSELAEILSLINYKANQVCTIIGFDLAMQIKRDFDDKNKQTSRKKTGNRDRGSGKQAEKQVQQ